MPTPRPSHRSRWLALAAWLCASVAGCVGEKPVGDSANYHPQGIGIENEAGVVPGKPKR